MGGGVFEMKVVGCRAGSVGLGRSVKGDSSGNATPIRREVRGVRG